MRYFVVLLIVVILAILVFAGVALYLARETPEEYRLSKELKAMSIRRDIEEIRRATQQDAIAYRLQAAKLDSQEQLASSGMIAKSREIGVSLLYLWPLALFLAAGTGAGLYLYARKQQTIQAVQNTRSALILQSEEHTARVLEKVLPVYARAMCNHVQPPAPVALATDADIVEPGELPAFTGNVHFSQAMLDEDYDDRAVLMGRNIETGALCQLPLEELQSFCTNGLQKQGKSVLLLAQVYSALYRQYVLQEDVRAFLVDIHGGYRDSIVTRLESMVPGVCSLFERVFQGEDEIERDCVGFLDALIESGKAARNGDRQPLTCVFFDEYTETVSALPSGKDIEARCKRLFNYRKAGIFQSLVMFEGGKNSNSAKGLNVSKMSVSRALFHTNKDEGSRFLPGGNSAQHLDKGEYLLLLPGMAEPERIKAALFDSRDFAMFVPYVTQESQRDECLRPESHALETHADSTETTLTPDVVKQYLADNSISQNALAKSAGLSKTDLSRWMNQKLLSPEKSEIVETAIALVLFPKNEKIINLQQYRDAL